MKAMVFAAGLGTRLRPITDTLPKALVPVCGEPLLGHVLRKLQRSGYTEAVVNVHHFPQLIKDYLADKDFGLKLSVSDESGQLLETGGGILHAKELLQGGEPFLAHNVDIVSDVDLAWFRAQMHPGALATLLVSERKTSRYLLFNDDMRLVGWTNISTGEVRSPYPDLDPAQCRRYAFSGIHNISPAIFDAFDALKMPERFPIVDFYVKVCDRYPIYGAVAKDLQLVDVGKFETLPQAEAICRSILL